MLEPFASQTFSICFHFHLHGHFLCSSPEISFLIMSRLVSLPNQFPKAFGFQTYRMQDPFPPHTVLKILPVAHAFSDFFPIFLILSVYFRRVLPLGLPAVWTFQVVPNKASHRCALITQICLLLHKDVTSQTFSPVFLLPTLLIVVLDATMPNITNAYSLPPGLLLKCSDIG